MDHYFISGDEELEIVVEVLESFGRALKVIQLIFFFIFSFWNYLINGSMIIVIGPRFYFLLCILQINFC